MLFCQEGPCHKVDRIWMVIVSAVTPMLIRKRTVDMEIARPEFISRDRKRIWFNLQMSRGKTFYLSGKDLSTGEEIRYSLTCNE